MNTELGYGDHGGPAFPLLPPREAHELTGQIRRQRTARRVSAPVTASYHSGARKCDLLHPSSSSSPSARLEKQMPCTGSYGLNTDTFSKSSSPISQKRSQKVKKIIIIFLKTQKAPQRLKLLIYLLLFVSRSPRIAHWISLCFTC